MPANGNGALRLMTAGVAALGALALAGAGALFYGVGVEPDWIEVTQTEIELPRLPREFDRYRMVQLSDLHSGPWLPEERLTRIISMATAQCGDLIVLTGDYVTHASKDSVARFAPHLVKLRAPDGVLQVLGNHDYWGYPGPELIRGVLDQSGIVNLNNKVHTVRRGEAVLHIAGVDSAREHMDRLDLVLNALPPHGPAILLAHEPDFADLSSRTGRFDLQISGHSHGGQVAIPFLDIMPNLPPLGRKYPRGRYQVGKMVQYTNRGLGLVGLPIRFGARPEITVHTLRSGTWE